MYELVTKLIISLIKFYQKISSFLPPNCRFFPSCSNYMIQSIQKHGIFKGVLSGTVRICKCHPFHPGGYDPVQ